ncbi:hypothetical protein RUND412_011600 [Rhizina undulata]
MAMEFSASLAVGLWMMEKYGFICMQDITGKVWIAHNNCPFGVYLPPGGRRIEIAIGKNVKYHPWFLRILAAVLTIGRKPLTTTVPYRVAVRNWYAGHVDGLAPSFNASTSHALASHPSTSNAFTSNASMANDSSTSSSHTNNQHTMRAINGYVAFRLWFNDEIKAGNYHLTLAEVSSLCSSIWRNFRDVKGIWSYIAKKYTEDRDGGVIHHLPDLVRVEFIKVEVILNAARLAQSAGWDLERMKRQPNGRRRSVGSLEAEPINSHIDIASSEAIRLDLNPRTNAIMEEEHDDITIQGMTVTIPKHLQISHEEATRHIMMGATYVAQ